MSKRITAVAASALALALGCEQQGRTSGENESMRGQEEQVTNEQQTGFNQQPEDERIAQADQHRQQQMQEHQQRQQQMGQQQQGSQGQVVTETSENNLDRTVSQLNRQLRQNDLDVVATIRYDERMRQRLMRQQGQQARGQQQRGQEQQAQEQQQMGQQSEIGDVRLLVFRRPSEEAQMIENQGPESLLQSPRSLLVYERGEDVIVAYEQPQQQPTASGEEPTAQLLERIVQESTQSTSRRQASAQQERQQEQQASVQQSERGQQQQEQQAMAQRQRREQQQQQ